MDLFSIDKNGKFILNFYDNVVVDLESLFAKIKCFSLKEREQREFEFEDYKRTKQKFNVHKIDANSYKLWKFSKNRQRFQLIYLYEKVNLITENEIYPIYCEFQVNYLIEKILRLKDCTFYLIEEDKKKKQINLNDFEYYPGRNIEIKGEYKNKLDYIFKRKKNEEKKLINLTLNLDGLFEKQELNDKVFDGEGRKLFQKELDILYHSYKEKFKYYCGQSGIGKTVSLLDYRYKTYHNILYLNMNTLFKAINFLNDFNQALKNELIYLFDNYDNYISFIEKYEKEIFLSSFEILDSNKLKFTIIEKLIDKLLYHLMNKGEVIMIIIDQYNKKLDYKYGLTNKLEKYTERNRYLKIVCCCSMDEVDIRDDIYDSIFERLKAKKNFISIKNLIKIDISNLTDKQKKVSEIFGNLPKYFYRIKNTPEKVLDSFIDTLQEEIYNNIRESIKNLNIDNQIIYGLLMVIYNINKKIDKSKLKSLFNYIFLKYITITPINRKENYLIDFWEEKEEDFILNYSFPIITSVFKLILKEYKQKEYKQHLIDGTEEEEDYILKYLINSSFESGEKPFMDELEIFKSYEVDQIFCLSKIFVDANEKEKILKTKREDYINGLFEIGKNYHLYQKNECAPKFDGSLLISAQKNNIEEVDNINENDEINLAEEKNENNENKKTFKKNVKTYDLIIYQSTKRKGRNRTDNNFVTKNKDMIIKNFELLFNIKIRKLNFIYILIYEKKDESLMTFCELIENQISYIFYSIVNNKFANRNGEEVRVTKYITDIRSYRNLIQYININKERNEKFLKKMISDIPADFDVEKGNKFLTIKRNRDKEKKGYKKQKNFLCFYDSVNNLILNEDININNKTNYEKLIQEKKQNFFDDFDIEEDEKDNNNEISENQSNIENKYKNKDELIKDIVYKDRHTNEFTPEYNKKIKNIILKIYSGKKEKIKIFSDKNIVSYYCGIYDINILNNLVNLPFYYLYRNKKTKDIKIFIKDNNETKIFNYLDENEIKDYDYYKEINSMMDVEKFNENNLIICCFIVDPE